jgi:phosphoribosylformylglycinamidine synthase
MTVAKYGIPLVVIGRVRAGGRVRLWRHGKMIVDLPAASVTDSVPMCPLPSRVRLAVPKAPRLPVLRDPGKALLRLLSTPSLGSKRAVWRQYDHMVRTNTMILPGSDAAVIRLKGTDKLIALSTDGPGRLCAADPFIGGQLAMAESARNVACAGARPVAFTNGLNFPNPDRDGNLWQFSEVVRGIALAARKLATPVVSGNVSFYNEHKAKGIDPTPIIGMLGVMDGWKPVAQWFAREGDVVVRLGPVRGSLNASAYQYVVAGRSGGRPAPVDWKSEKAVQRALVESAKRGLLASAHDLSEGGFLVALAECCVSGADADVPLVGCRVSLKSGGTRLDELMFGEAPSQVIVSMPESALKSFGKLATGTTWALIGRVGGGALSVVVDGRVRVDLPLARLAKARSKPLSFL